MEYFGSDETVAGTAAGKRLAAAGAKHVLCVLQAQGQVQLEARCAGVQAGLGSEGTMTKLYVNGTDNAAMLSTMSAKLDPGQERRRGHHAGRAGRPGRDQRRSSRRTAPPSSTPSTPTPREIAKIKSGQVQWAVDQQPYLQGYEAIDSLWLFKTNADVLGGGQTVLTGPSFIDASNIGTIAPYAARGTR